MSLNGREQRQVKAIKKILFGSENPVGGRETGSVEIYFKIRALQEKQKQQTKKRHAECIKTFCLTILVFFFGKKENKFYFMLLQPGKCFSFFGKKQ